MSKFVWMFVGMTLAVFLQAGARMLAGPTECLGAAPPDSPFK